MTPIDVVICGNIRSEIALYEIVREVLLAKREGLVNQAVFATWTSERERFPKLSDALADQGVDVVTLDPPEPYTGSLVIQHLQFWRGLQALADDDHWVLKTRTEKAFPQTFNVFEALRHSRLDLDGLSRPAEVFERKVILQGASVDEPFAHADLTFLAHKRDARRLLNLDAAFDYVLSDAGYFPQEARWFVSPVMARFPELKRVHERVSTFRLAHAIEQGARADSLSTAPEAVIRYLGAYWPLANDLFGLVDVSDYGHPPLTADVLAGRVERPFAQRWGDRVLATNQGWLSHLAQGASGADKLLRRAAAFRVEPSRYGEALREVDLDALTAFTDQMLGAPPTVPARTVQTPGQPSADLDLPSVFTALVRAELAPAAARSGFDEVEAAVQWERGHGASQRGVLDAAQRLDQEARAEGDRGRAQIAFMLYLSAAWARVPEAVDGACSLAYDGFVSPEQRREAFETIYTVWMQDPTSPLALFWYGVEHITGWTSAEGHTNLEHGLTLIRAAAAGGFPRAQEYLDLM